MTYGSLFINRRSQLADTSCETDYLSKKKKKVLLAEFVYCLFLPQHLTWKHFRGRQTKWGRLWWPLKHKGSQLLFLRCSRSPLFPTERVNCPKYVLKNHWNRNWFAHKLRVLVPKPEKCSLSVLLRQGTFQYLTENYTASAAVPLQRYKTALLQSSHDPGRQIFQGQI